MWWTEDGSCILSSHSDGSYCSWTLRTVDEREEEEKSNVPYGEEENLFFSFLFFPPIELPATFVMIETDRLFSCSRTFSLQGHQ